MRPAIGAALHEAIDGLRALEPGDAFEPRAATVIVEAGLHRLCVPAAAGGLGASMAEAAEVLMAIGAVDGSTGLGFAMQVHVTGALRDADGAAGSIRERLYRAILDDGALVNNAATEEGGGSPARGAIPGTRAEPDGDDPGSWRLTGEKTWTTWLPNLTHAFVTARLPDDDPSPDAPPTVGTFLVDLATPGVERREGFEAMGMRGSASGRLVLDTVRVPADALVQRRQVGEPDLRGAAPLAWFGVSIAATYLGVGEGARAEVVRWAMERRPGDGSTAVAEIPSVQLRLGRMDAELRAARIVVLDVARRWDQDRAADDIGLAKLTATRAAVTATDEALRIAGGPGFLAGRLERAFRDARAGLINPPLEDVALQGFGRLLVDSRRVAMRVSGSRTRASNEAAQPTRSRTG
ncbi:MAG: acyl-CoA/acyl-ACP dehydrogenase [Chloroflexi bacterium]|nr:acyl-CoA/acyl-ACP dehydrogenase [Chloroflexota bacterium]